MDNETSPWYNPTTLKRPGTSASTTGDRAALPAARSGYWYWRFS